MEEKKLNKEIIIKSSALLIGLSIALLWLVSFITKLSVNYWWFQSMDYQQVFTINLTAKFLTFAVTTGIIIIILSKLLNKELFIGNKKSILQEISKLDSTEYWQKQTINKLKVKLLALKIFKPVVILVSILLGYIFSSFLWYKILVFLNRTTFGVSDPVYHNDISFYIFTLPLIRTVQWLLLALSILALIILIVRAFKEREGENDSAIPLCWRSIWAIIAVIVATLYWTGRYSILYNTSGAVYGAGYIDIAVWKQFYPIMTILLLAAAVSCLLIKKESFIKILDSNIGLIKQPAIIILVIMLVSIGFGLTAWVVEFSKLTPNEEELERPYLERNIELTG